MREALKQHPWRLEILPFLMVVTTAIVPMMHWQEMSGHATPLPGLTPDVSWMLRYVGRVLFGFLLCIVGWQINRQWSWSEREKRFNFWAVLTVVGLGVFGWFVCSKMFGLFWLELTLLTVGVQSAIEARRPFYVLQRTADSETVEIEPGEKFYYREGARFSIPLELLLALLTAAVFAVAFLGSWMGVIPAFIGAAYGSIVGWKEIVISREKIAARFGPFRLMIPITQVRSCAVADPHPLTESFRGHRGWGRTYDGMEIFGDSTAPMLKIDTTEGKTFLVGMKKPGTACALINSALSNLS